MLVYNLFLFFNWDVFGMSDYQMMDFIFRIVKFGFCWQFIIFVGFYVDVLVIDIFVKDYVKRGMLVYVERIQREERSNGVDIFVYQKWLGVNYYDCVFRIVQGGIIFIVVMGKGYKVYFF